MKLENENTQKDCMPTASPVKKGDTTKGDFINTIGFKLIVITVLMLLLMLPASMIESIIKERENQNLAAVAEVSEKWAGSQEINGPILTIPVSYSKMEGETERVIVKNWNILPQVLKVDGTVIPEKLRRGIYEVVVYKSDMNVKGSFDLDQELDTTGIIAIHYEKAFVTMGIADLRGIKNQIQFKWNKKTLKIEPGSALSPIIKSGVTIKIPELSDSTNEVFGFEFNLDLQGSKELSFIPLGGITEVSLQSTWEAPSFKGKFLPDSRKVSKDGFQANWKVLELNKNFPQSFVGSGFSNLMMESSFGVDLIVPLDDYQKSFRSVKYAAMTIALTFLIFFLIEILNNQRIHPLQYALVGLALCLFYILLVAISEHTDFNIAYGFSTFGIVAMISLYSLSIFKAKRMTWILVSLLILIYGFLFVTLQLTDYALLMGSVGLVIILAATMFFTRKVDWYGLKLNEK
ncbi:MAG: inner membrane protein [Vicingaceae bacterium]|jgi:inner membrane protein